MSFLNFFKKKSKTDDKKDDDTDSRDGEVVKDRKVKKQLSISRSGRYKQKKQRGGVADRPELFLDCDKSQRKESMSKSSGSSPSGSCREINGKVMPGGMRLNGQMAS